jgi:hypothetical protein
MFMIFRDDHGSLENSGKRQLSSYTSLDLDTFAWEREMLPSFGSPLIKLQFFLVSICMRHDSGKMQPI